MKMQEKRRLRDLTRAELEARLQAIPPSKRTGERDSRRARYIQYQLRKGGVCDV
jgi:hypothetical protein